jgi:hypothetical protein
MVMSRLQKGGSSSSNRHSVPVLAVLIVFAMAHTYYVVRNHNSHSYNSGGGGGGGRVLSSFLEREKPQPEPVIHMVTFSNRLRVEECQSFRSLWMAGVPIHAVGIDESYLGTDWWETMKQKPDASGTIMKKLKVFATYDYLQTLPPQALIVFNDASDVIYSPRWDPTRPFQQQLWSTVQAIHRAQGTNPRETTIFGAERTCWPFFINGAPRMAGAAKMCNRYPPSPTTYRYLNSGNWIAFRDPALRLLEQWKHDLEFKPDIQSDQHAAAYLYVNQTFPIVLDFHHEIFGNDAFPLMTSQELEIDYETGVFTNLETDAHPQILHFNGGKLGFVEAAQKLYDHGRKNWTDNQTETFSNAMKESIRFSGGRLLECTPMLNPQQS